MNYKGFELERVATDYNKRGYEYLCYWNDELAGGTDTYPQMTKLIDTMIQQNVKHESLIKEEASV